MPEYTGYKGETLEFLKKSQIGVGDSVRIISDITYLGIVMPRYEHGDDRHVVVKLKSGYNVGLETASIEKIEKIPAKEKTVKEPHAEKKKGLSRILLLSTGGTIASKIDYRTGAVTPVLTAEELNESVPELGEMADIDTEVLFSEYSENIVPDHWIQIAQRIAKCSEYSGVIIAHGTDTMHYTSSFLSFALAGFSTPVVLVGSQRSTDRASSDAALNLMGAARFIINDGSRGIWIVMHHDENDNTIACHAGTRVRKNHTSKRGAFETIGADPAFIISENTIQKNITRDYFNVKQFTPQIKLDTRIALVKYHPGYDSKIFDHIIDSGCRGIIFEGTGLGHVGRTMYQSIKRANEKGVFLGMTSQCIDGKISMTVYESGRDLLDLGVVPLDMIPETALVKAMWAAGNFGQIKDAMLNDMASEFSQ
ncbi:MAG: Glu-tRNA(Gln) amidotransferase GatDE subunit D [Nitrosopumilus sp. B06]|nr:MAG: Glu-tRNA(Gln) amidotransferase GatDE subunit D [Nitrosopumilus sp. B06]